jgi:hypothetical protein
MRGAKEFVLILQEKWVYAIMACVVSDATGTQEIQN